jgi:predicted TIM-barrel enzyme
MDFKKKPILGMLHMYGGKNASDIMDDELTIFEEEGVDGYIIENYGGGMEEVRKGLQMTEEFDNSMYKGINILPNNFEVAYALAEVYRLDFIQLDYIAGAYKGRTPGQVIKLDVNNYNRFRDRFPDIKILGGVHPKYYEPIAGSDLTVDIQDAMERCDAIVITGAGTGKVTPLDKIKEFRKLVGINFPLIVGAGLDEFNVEEQIAHADGGIVGSYLKTNGQAIGKVERDRVRDFMAKVNKHRVKTLL